MIYLDSAAMSRPLPAALDAFRTAPFGNPSSEHEIGQNARNALEHAREKIAELMDCEPDEIVFTATATEAAAFATRSLSSLPKALLNLEAKYENFERFHWFISPYEHHAISENLNALYSGPEYGEPIGGNIYIQMLAQNEVGELFSPPKRNQDDVWLCDATAAVGHVPVSFKILECDYLIADALKFGGVPGAAFLIAKKGTPLSPLIRGGGQERGMRSGTENVPAICAMAAALAWQVEHMDENHEKLEQTEEYLYDTLSEIPGHKWNTDFTNPHLPHILNISFIGVDAHALALLLSKDGVMVSPGAACSNGLHEPSHVIMAMFHDEDRARSAIRISFSHENTIEEIRIAAEKIKDAVAYLRSVA